MMNHLKDFILAEGKIKYFLTYADNYAIGYFKKQVRTKRFIKKKKKARNNKDVVLRVFLPRSPLIRLFGWATSRTMTARLCCRSRCSRSTLKSAP